MTRDQTTVIWLGLLLVVLNLVVNIGQVKQIIFGSGSSSSPSGGSPTIGIPGQPGSNKPGIPIDPFIPGIPITIPLSATATPSNVQAT